MQLPQHFAGAIGVLHEQAAGATGLADFGDPAYREGLQVLLESYDDTARFGELGRYSAWAMLVNCLRGRLYAIDGVKSNPECLDTGIENPLFIVGLPRTGTTILHRLLASMPGNQALECWLGSYPQPRPDRNSWPGNERYREVAQSLQMLNEINPELKKIHEMSAEGADECRMLLMQSFANVTFQANATVPAYTEWLYQADMRPVYQLYVQTLKLIGVNDTGKRWVLKDPSHLWALDVLLETFPDATVIQTHRDPVKLIPSVCSLVLTARRMQEPEVTPEAVGVSEINQWERVLKRGMAVRERHPDRFVDLHFDNFVTDPVAAVQGIYRRLGENLDEGAADGLRSWMKQHPQHQHGGHDYKPEDFGLDGAQIRERFTDYCNYFEVRQHVA